MTINIRLSGLITAILIAFFYVFYLLLLDFNNLSNYNSYSIAGGSISNLFIILTVLIIPVCLMASYNNIVHGYSMYISLILILELILIYLFSTTDLIGFYVAFELALLPLYILVGCYGASSNRLRASLLLWSYTMIGSLCLLVGVVYLIVTIGTSDFNLLSIYSLNLYDTRIIWILFAIGLAIKVPSVPFHIWLPRAHVEANVSCSILLAAIILKLSTYGSLILLLDSLTSATAYYQDLWLWLALVSFLHSSIVTVIQIDSKTLIAYSSVAHMAIITVGLHSNNYISIIGAVLLAVAHASSSSSLFIIFGQIIYDRLHTRTIYYLRNIGSYMPSLRTLILMAIVANSATPGSINWLAEFYVLIGSTYQNLVVSIIITSTVLLTAIYSFWMYTYVNGNTGNNLLADCTKIEITTLLYLLIPGFIVGIYPSSIENFLLSDSLVLCSFTPMFVFNSKPKILQSIIFHLGSLLLFFLRFVLKNSLLTAFFLITTSILIKITLNVNGLYCSYNVIILAVLVFYLFIRYITLGQVIITSGILTLPILIIIGNFDSTLYSFLGIGMIFDTDLITNISLTKSIGESTSNSTPQVPARIPSPGLNPEEFYSSQHKDLDVPRDWVLQQYKDTPVKQTLKDNFNLSDRTLTGLESGFRRGSATSAVMYPVSGPIGGSISGGLASLWGYEAGTAKYDQDQANKAHKLANEANAKNNEANAQRITKLETEAQDYKKRSMESDIRAANAEKISKETLSKMEEFKAELSSKFKATSDGGNRSTGSNISSLPLVFFSSGNITSISYYILGALLLVVAIYSCLKLLPVFSNLFSERILLDYSNDLSCFLANYNLVVLVYSFLLLVYLLIGLTYIITYLLTNYHASADDLNWWINIKSKLEIVLYYSLFPLFIISVVLLFYFKLPMEFAEKATFIYENLHASKSSIHYSTVSNFIVDYYVYAVVILAQLALGYLRIILIFNTLDLPKLVFNKSSKKIELSKLTGLYNINFVEGIILILISVVYVRLVTNIVSYSLLVQPLRNDYSYSLHQIIFINNLCHIYIAIGILIILTSTYLLHILTEKSILVDENSDKYLVFDKYTLSTKVLLVIKVFLSITISLGYYVLFTSSLVMFTHFIPAGYIYLISKF